MRRRGNRSPHTRRFWNRDHVGTLPEHATMLREALVACYTADPAASSAAVLAYFEALGLGRFLGRDHCARRNALHDLIHSAKRRREEVANGR